MTDEQTTTLYRVYESYHDSAESGTHEYGIYDSLSAAQERCREVYPKRARLELGPDFPAPLERFYNDGSGCVEGGEHFYAVTISYRPYVLNEPIDDNATGYT